VPPRSTYHNCCKQAREHGAFAFDVDVLTRISAVLGIHQIDGKRRLIVASAPVPGSRAMTMR
jgi:hypothetical protein